MPQKIVVLQKNNVSSHSCETTYYSTVRHWGNGKHKYSFEWSMNVNWNVLNPMQTKEPADIQYPLRCKAKRKKQIFLNFRCQFLVLNVMLAPWNFITFNPNMFTTECTNFIGNIFLFFFSFLLLSQFIHISLNIKHLMVLPFEFHGYPS